MESKPLIVFPSVGDPTYNIYIYIYIASRQVLKLSDAKAPSRKSTAAWEVTDVLTKEDEESFEMLGRYD